MPTTCLSNKLQVNKFEHVLRKGSLCSKVQPEQVWTCLACQGWGPVQVGPELWSCKGGQGPVQGGRAGSGALYDGNLPVNRQADTHDWKHNLCHSVGRH